MDPKADVTHPAIKASFAWATILFTSWAEFASFLAAVYTLLLMGEWIWKKVIRPYLIKQGKIMTPKRRREDYDRSGDEDADITADTESR